MSTGHGLWAAQVLTVYLLALRSMLIWWSLFPLQEVRVGIHINAIVICGQGQLVFQVGAISDCM